MSFPKYERYKDSGVEWLGEVPEHWEVKRLRFVVELNPSKVEVANLNRDMLASFLPMEAIGEDGSLRIDLEKPIGELESGYTYFRNGDVTIAKITPCYENGKGALMDGLVNGIGFGTTELIVARPKPKEIIGSYLHYLFISSVFRSIGESHMYGAGGQKRVPDVFVRNFSTALPPLLEQNLITTFLNNEIAKLDKLVVEQQRLIELLKEKRQAAISHAVTRGLSPNVKLKPSGIEWIGDVPVHWDVKKLRYLCNIQTGARDTEHAVEDGEFPFFVRSQTIEQINSKSFDCEAVLTAGDGAGVGKVFHYYEGPFDFHQRVYMMNNFKGILGRFFFHYFREHFYRVALEGGAKSTVDSLRRPMLTNFPVCLPPKDEQEEIIRAVEKSAASFDILTTEAQRAIDLLQERRTALISAAVTGKIDVRQLNKN